MRLGSAISLTSCGVLAALLCARLHQGDPAGPQQASLRDSDCCVRLVSRGIPGHGPQPNQSAAPTDAVESESPSRRVFLQWIDELTGDRDDIWVRLRRQAGANPDAGFRDVNPRRWVEWLDRQSDEDLVHASSNWRFSELHVSDPDRDDYIAAMRHLAAGRITASRTAFEAFLDGSPTHMLAVQARAILDALVPLKDALWQEERAVDANSTTEDLISSLRRIAPIILSEPAERMSALRPPARRHNAAMELLRRGEASLPVLAPLLLDRRLTRLVSWTRRKARERIVLRFQDVALEIIEAVAQIRFFERSGPHDYLSQHRIEVWADVARRVDDWRRAVAGLDGEPRLIATLHFANTREFVALALPVARRSRDPSVFIAAAHRRYESDIEWRPELCEFLVELGDRSRLAETLAARARWEAIRQSPRPGRMAEMARALNALETLERLRLR